MPERTLKRLTMYNYCLFEKDEFKSIGTTQKIYDIPVRPCSINKVMGRWDCALDAIVKINPNFSVH